MRDDDNEKNDEDEVGDIRSDIRRVGVRRRMGGGGLKEKEKGRRRMRKERKRLEVM